MIMHYSTTMKIVAINALVLAASNAASCTKQAETPTNRKTVITDTVFHKIGVTVSVPEPEDAEADTLFSNERAVVTYHTMGTYFVDTIEYASTRFVIKAVGDDRMLVFPDNDIFTRNYKPRRKDFALPHAAYEEFSNDSIYGGYPEVNSMFFSYIPKDTIFKLTAIYPARLSPKEFMSRLRIYPASAELLKLHIYKQFAYKKSEIAIMFPGGDINAKDTYTASEQ